MLKKFLVSALVLIMAFSLVACGGTQQEQPEGTPTPTPEPTPEPLMVMTDDLLGESTLSYKTLIKNVKAVYEKNISKADTTEPFDIDNGISAALFNVLKDGELFDCNVLGYKYEDKNGTSYLKAIYKEYEGKPYDIEMEGIYLTYEFNCENKEYAFKLMDRDVKTLCAFAGVDEAQTSKEVTQATCDAMVTDNTALTVIAGKNVSAEITVKNADSAVTYKINVVIK